MNKPIVFMLFVLFALTSCASTKTTTKGSYIRFPQKDLAGTNNKVKTEKVEIYYKKSPPYKFVEIGIVEAIAHGKEAGLVDLFPELQKQAAIIGSSAVYKIELQRYNQTGDALHATGIAIKKHFNK